jgi:cytochrome P450
LASVLLASESKPGNGLLTQLKNEAASTNEDWHDAIAANGVGFLSQAYEATAALIASTLLNLARQPEILERAKANGDLLSDFIQEVLRSDAPVQNTRRYLAEDGVIAGQEVKAGDGVLVLLAAANHDPNANPTPERFELSRLHRQIFTFGRGVHACPGQTLAQEIAEAGVRQWIRAHNDLTEMLGKVAYQESVNIRMALFTHRSK